MSSTSTADPSATSSGSSSSTTTSGGGGGNGGGGGPQSSPLLFFVALGFGVVFTNLWIIVGVKYCFRYNQRNRQLRAMAENGEPIDLANMHGPRRRRREKKLMTMEEVNERFPLIKYKLWRSKREAEGLPTEGGVNPSASRAASIKSKRAASVKSKRETIESAGGARTSKESVRHTETVVSDAASTKADAEASTAEKAKVDTKPDANLAETKTDAKDETAVQEKPADVRPAPPTVVDADDDDIDDDDPIRTAVAPEMLSTPGDSCAICIDTLEDDDDVRGLSCGHAFHASCVDPWLTSRRACCPLCKADYYIPKPRPEGSEDPTAGAGQHSVNLGIPPGWVGSRGPFTLRGLPFFSRPPVPVATNAGEQQQQPVPAPRRGLFNFSRASPQTNHEATDTGARSRLPALPTLRLPRFGRAPPPAVAPVVTPPPPAPATAEESTTPSELEAGRANNVAR